MAKQELSKAELYRQERNKRLNETSKKNAKRKQKHPKLGKIIKATVSIVLAVALVGGSAYYLFAKYSGIPERVKAVMTVGEQKISLAQYEIAYLQKYNYNIDLASQYKQYYGYDVYGFSETTAPATQQSPFQDDAGNYLYWDEYLKDETIKSLKELFVLYADAVANKYTLNEDEIADIEKSMEELRTTALKSNLGINAYLKTYFGNGVNKNVYREYLEITTLVTRFQKDKQKAFSDKYTNEILQKEYDKKPDDFDVVSVRYFKFDYDTLTKEDKESDKDFVARKKAANAEINAFADAMLKKITDEASFITASEDYNKKVAARTEKTSGEKVDSSTYDAGVSTEFYRTSYSTLKSSISDDAAKWAFADGSKVLEKSIFKTDAACFVVLLLDKQFPTNTIDVRHILIKFNSTGTEATDDDKATAKKKAEGIYDDWKKGDATEESFGELAKQNSEDNADKGGLYEAVSAGAMVAAFDNWCFDKSRRAGDTGIVETEYGYHIMYFVSNNTDDPNWRSDLREKHTQDDYSAYLEALLAADTNKAIEKAANIGSATDSALVAIDTIIASNSSNSQSS